MANNNRQVAPKDFFAQANVQKKFEELLGKKSQGFISSVLQVVNSNNRLKNANPISIYTAAATAAALDLPINQNLGFAWIVPYKGNAQFQMGYKGYVQLAIRSGQYKRINVIKIYENQFKSYNVLTEELDADFTQPSTGKVVGYAAYLSLTTGFEKLVYWDVEKVSSHGKKYSKSFNNGPWRTDFDAMAMKTVLKNTISKWGIMSIEMNTALIYDQSVQKKEGEAEYPDNGTIDIEAIDEEKERQGILEHINNAQTIEELQQVRPHVSQYGLGHEYEDKENELAVNNK